MDKVKVDFLNECMSEFRNAPIDAFNRQFCVVCSNRECSRSWGNNSTFDTRVKNWRSVLFENVQRKDDPNISNPKFELVEPGRVPEIRPSVFETIPAAPPLSYEDVPDTDPDSPILVSPANVVVTPPQTEPVPIMNTPFDKPVMLGGAEEKTEEKMEPGSVFIFEDE